MKKRLYFLAGLPRTGSTLLGALLTQNIDIYVSPTSALYGILKDVSKSIELLSTQYTFDAPKTCERLTKAIISAYYEDIEQPIIFDKHRDWADEAKAIKQFIGIEPKIVCTIRPLAEIITSYIVLADKDPDNFIDQHLRALNRSTDNESRAALLWEHYVSHPYKALLQGVNHNRTNLLLIDYRDVVFATQDVINRVCKFCEIEPFTVNTGNISNPSPEDDVKWGMRGLHDIRATIGKQSAPPEAYLRKETIAYFEQLDGDLYARH